MRSLQLFLVASTVVAASWLSVNALFGETLVLSSGRTIEGTIIQTNGNDLVLLTDYCLFKFGRDNVKAIQGAQAEVSEQQSTNRFPSFRTAILALSRRKWVVDLTQIPATVIVKGVFRDVPYISFRCAEDHEVNIYGDLSDPAAIEAGLYRKLLTEDQAKGDCLEFIGEILGERKDRAVLQALSRQKDLKVRNGLSFEVTPPTDADAYQGWWISVYSEEKLDRARASEKEMQEISVSKAAVPGGGAQHEGQWSAEELKLARPSQPLTISFRNSIGDSVQDAEVVRVEGNAYVIWRKGASGGKLRLSNLSEDLQKQLGYDPAKAAGSYAAEEQRQAELAQEKAQAFQSVALTQPVSMGTDSNYGSSSSSSGGRVYVHGYTKANGTYVQAYTRRAPSR